MPFPAPSGSAPGSDYAWDPKQATWVAFQEFCAENEIWNEATCSCSECTQGEQPGPCYTWSSGACAWIAPVTDCPPGTTWDWEACACQGEEVTPPGEEEDEDEGGDAEPPSDNDQDDDTDDAGNGSSGGANGGGSATGSGCGCPSEPPPGSGSCTVPFTVRSLTLRTLLVSATVHLYAGADGEAAQTLLTGASGDVSFELDRDQERAWRVWRSGYHVGWGSLRCGSAVTAWLASSTPDPAASGATDLPGSYPAFTALYLQEDPDGIVPRRRTQTEDRTPTLSWAVSGGSGGERFEWRLYHHETQLVSGATLLTQVELPLLAPENYRFSVRAWASDGKRSLWNDLYFEIFTCLPCPGIAAAAPELYDPPPTDWVRYLPRWLNLFGDGGRANPDSLFWKFWEPSLRQMSRFSRDLQQQLDQRTLMRVAVDLPRQAWLLQTGFTVKDTLTCTVRASGTVSEVRRSESLSDFLGEIGPVYLLDDRGRMLFRNLTTRRITLAPDGSGGLASRYTFPAEPGIVEDASVYFQASGSWYRVPAGSPGLYPVQAMLLLPEGYSGNLEFLYQSRGYRGSVEVSVSGTPFRAPTRVDLANQFDEFALLAGLERRRGESNLRLRERTQSRMLAPLGGDAAHLAQRISQETLLTYLLDWDGRRSLNFQASGYFGITGIEALELPEVELVEEELVRQSPGHYYTSRQPGDSVSLFLVDGIPVSPLRYPNLGVSGNLVSFGAPVTGQVRAYYQARNYRLTYSGRGTITELTPVSGNVSSGEYRLLLTRAVRAKPADDPRFREGELLAADGSATGLFRELRDRILDASPTYLGRARWSQAHWLSEGHTAPPTAHLPILFDRVQEGS